MKTVDILRKAKAIYESGRYSGMSCRRYRGMCTCIWEAIEEYEYVTEDEFNNFIKNNIPLFSYDVAVENFGATGIPDSYWWDERDEDIRIEYFDWLIEQYKDK